MLLIKDNQHLTSNIQAHIRDLLDRPGYSDVVHIETVVSHIPSKTDYSLKIWISSDTSDTSILYDCLITLHSLAKRPIFLSSPKMRWFKGLDKGKIKEGFGHIVADTITTYIRSIENVQ